MKALVWAGLLIGSIVGGYLPSLWGASIFSFQSVIFSAIGGGLGLWLGYKIGDRYF